MSLDVTLINKEKSVVCSNCEQQLYKDIEVYTANITHNLSEMANKAGIYKYLWRPEEINCNKARHLIQVLKIGLANLKNRPDYFKQFDSPDGWGLYVHFVPFVEEYLNACIKYPNAKIGVWK